MLMLLFGSMSVSTGELKKAIDDWHFSQLAGEVMGERAQTGTAEAKTYRNPESSN